MMTKPKNPKKQPRPAGDPPRTLEEVIVTVVTSPPRTLDEVTVKKGIEK